jgi:transposase InsO family protein
LGAHVKSLVAIFMFLLPTAAAAELLDAFALCRNSSAIGSTSRRMNTDFCTEAVEEALAKYGKPEIINIDQGAQFTSADLTRLLETNDIAISWTAKVRGVTTSSSHGSGRRSIPRRSNDTPTTACPRLALGRYIDFYNRRRTVA